MSEVTEERMDHLETKIDDLKHQIAKISRGLFGDEEFDDHGVVQRISNLEKDMDIVKGNNDRQQISITAKKVITDDTIMWLQRIFWLVAVLLGAGLVLTGKIGFADLFK